jgi:chloride channel, nucleotide-sensitive, 1A
VTTIAIKKTLVSTMPAVNLISTVPTFTSQDEHTALVGSTPNSFTDIPPVIRHKEENVSVNLEPQLQGFSDQDAAQGTLYVLTRLVAFNLHGSRINFFFGR